MIPSKLDQIDHAVLKSLLGSKLESKTFEVKRELALDGSGKDKLLKTVVALANTLGGDFVIGVAETDGILAAADGAVPKADVDRYKLTVKNLLRDNIEPALIGIEIQEVDCQNDRYALVVRVPRSWAGPHRNKADGQFYYRTSVSSERMDVADLRRAFGQSEAGYERIETFRRDRLNMIMSGETPAPLSRGPCAVLHAAPLPAFANRETLDVVNMVMTGTHMPMPFRGGGGPAGVNLSGVYNLAGQQSDGIAGYGQVFRNLAYERVSTSSRDGEIFYFSGPEFAKRLVEALQTTAGFFASYAISFPIIVMLSFCHAERMHLRVATDYGGYQDLNPQTAAVLAYPEIVMEYAQIDAPSLAKPLLDMIWNTYGQPRCTCYNPDGSWNLL